MSSAYLQNKKAKYYYIADSGKVELTDLKKPLQFLPEVINSPEETDRTAFIFRGEGLRILSHIFFTKGNDGDCVLTLEADDNICGDLDFSTARIFSGKEIRISCIHF
jgi:hypothetical protein